MAFEDFFLARARVDSRRHRRISLDDKVTFFQQLAALVASGTYRDHGEVIRTAVANLVLMEKELELNGEQIEL